MKNFFLKHKKRVLAVAGLLLTTWALTYVWDQNNRYPAAVQGQNFFEMFKPEKAIHSALHKEIVTSLQVAKNQKEFHIQIRNFLVRENGINQPLCNYFNEYKMTFEAEGIASSGERPTLTITSPCLVSERTKLPHPVKIPVEDIFKLKPSDTDISFQVNENALFSFKNIYDSWPEYWVLSQIEFDHTQTVGRKVLIERKEIFELSQKPIVMEWSPF